MDCEPTLGDVALGKVTEGPTPHLNVPGSDGDRNAVQLMSPRPKVVPPLAKLGCHTSGTMVRAMRSQPGVMANGTTGWTFSTSCVWSLPGP